MHVATAYGRRRGRDTQAESGSPIEGLPLIAARIEHEDYLGREEPQPRTNPATSEPDYADDEREFMVAMDQYKRQNRRPFPTWHEALLVLKSLGYRQVEAAGELPKWWAADRKQTPRRPPRG